MTIWQLTDDDVEAVATQANSGRTLQQIAGDLQISVEMAACAMRKWPSVKAKRTWTGLAALGL
ncbi:MAG TPA: hypothetical protein VGK74_21175 [Symbiobacteriaceae bacterium]